VRDDRNVYPVKEGQRYINLTLAAFLFYSHPKRESDRKLVGWLEFTSLFSTNMAISETKGIERLT